MRRVRVRARLAILLGDSVGHRFHVNLPTRLFAFFVVPVPIVVVEHWFLFQVGKRSVDDTGIPRY